MQLFFCKSLRHFPSSLFVNWADHFFYKTARSLHSFNGKSRICTTNTDNKEMINLLHMLHLLSNSSNSFTISDTNHNHSITLRLFSPWPHCSFFFVNILYNSAQRRDVFTLRRDIFYRMNSINCALNRLAAHDMALLLLCHFATYGRTRTLPPERPI